MIERFSCCARSVPRCRARRDRTGPIPAGCRCAGRISRHSRISRAGRSSGPPSITPIACWTRSLPRASSRNRRQPAEASPATMPRVTDILGRDGLIEPSPEADADAPVGDLTREPLSFPADPRSAAAEPGARRRGLRAGARLLVAARLWPQPSLCRRNPLGEVEVEFTAEDVGFACRLVRSR